MNKSVPRVLVALVFTGGAACTPSVPPGAAASAQAPAHTFEQRCRDIEFNNVAVEKRAAGATLLITAGQSSGSGFLLRAGRETLVVTNYHVVQGGRPYIGRVVHDDGQVQALPLEVSSVSRDDDLALLRPAAEIRADALVLADRPAQRGEAVAVLGYPGVAGSELRLTFEPGTVTASSRGLQGSEFIQTNANINPGNSGGPLVDRCGRVLGVVTGRHTMADRVGLVIPAPALVRLLARHRAPQPSKEIAVKQQLERLFKEVLFRRSDRAASYFSRAYIEKTSASELVRVAASATEKLSAMRRELKKRGKDPSKLPDEELARVVSARLSPVETHAFALSTAVQRRKLSPFDAAARFLNLTATERFGKIEDIWIENTHTSQQGCVDAYVTASAPEGPRRYVVHLHQELGEWLVESIEPVN